MSSPDALARPRRALDEGNWQEAIDGLDDIAVDERSAAWLELRAQAEYGNGNLEAAVGAWEDLHALQVQRGDEVEAARAAAMIAMYLMMDTGLMAPVRGWLRRAERLVGTSTQAPARALIAMVRTYERFMSGDMAAAGEQAALAIELGGELGVQPAVVIGRVAAARVKIFDGHVDEGLELLDEVGALLMSGQVDALTTGMMYCELICAAQGLALHERAGDWTDVMERWRHGTAFGGINGRCRVHRAEILRMSGPCDLAEEEALGACDELRPWMRREFGWPLTELGNIRLRKGDLDGAEEAFLAAHEHAWSPQPGLALLRLAQGDPESAAALIADAIAHPFPVPSKERPPFGDLRLAPLLDAQAEIAEATGDATIAKEAADALAAIAAAYPAASLVASASLAQARSSLLIGDHHTAIDASRASVAAWAELGAPFETAVARMVLGEAHRRAGNTEAAELEWQAAQAGFETFGAQRWARAAEARLDRSVPAVGAAPPAHAATFSCDGDTRTVVFDGDTAVLRDLKGLRYIERLLAEPNREFHVLDLVAVEQGTLPTGPASIDHDETRSVGAEAALPVLDEQAREAYRRRLQEVEEDIEDALRCNDAGRAELAERDRDYLIAELTHAVGLGGRHRSVGGSAERARTSVTRALRYALGKLADHHPAMASHLEASVHTGTYCAYKPDPLTTITWST